MFKWIVKKIYMVLIGHLISTLYTTLEPKKKKVKSLMVAVLRKVMLNGRYHEIIVGESSRFRWANRHSRSCFGLEPNSSSSFNAKGFSCSLGVLYGGLGVSKLQFFIKKIKIKFLVEIFFQF